MGVLRGCVFTLAWPVVVGVRKSSLWVDLDLVAFADTGANPRRDNDFAFLCVLARSGDIG